jgi:MoaA/NifB/PqqE/SkfB family radical SAM enzyme
MNKQAEELIFYVHSVIHDPKYSEDIEWVRMNLHPEHLRLFLRQEYTPIDDRDVCTCMSGSARYYTGTDGERHTERCARTTRNRTDLEWD